MKLQEHRKLGSNMESCLKHAANGHSQVGLTRKEIVRQKDALAKREALFEKARTKGERPTTRVANVRRIPSRDAFHVIGMGEVAGLTLNELKVKLGVNGYTGYRVGGLKFNLFA